MNIRARVEKIIDTPSLAIFLLLLAAVLPYLNVLHNEFSYDDVFYFLDWSGIRDLNIVSFFAGDAPRYYHHVYRPLRSVLQALIWQIVESKVIFWHFFSIAVHSASTVMIYLISKKITNKHVALLASVIFAVLPVHVASITFVIASLNSAGVLLLLLAFYCYLLATETKQNKYLFLSLIFAILAYFSYELTVILVLLLVLYDICIRSLTWSQLKKLAPKYILYLVGVVIFFIVRTFVLNRVGEDSALTPINFTGRMLTMTKAYMQYIELVIVNAPLSVYHEIAVTNTLDGKVILSILGLLGLTVSAVLLFKKGEKIYTFCIGWFFISLLPVSNFIQIASFVDEQYLYLASYAWALGLALLIYAGYDRWRENSRLITWSLIVCTAVIFGWYAYGTWSRNFVWHNDESLWLATIHENPRLPKGYNNLAVYYKRIGADTLAEQYLIKLSEINSDYSLTYVNLGEIALKKGDFEGAVKQFEKAASLNSRRPSIFLDLGLAYATLHENTKAEESYLKAIELNANYFEPHFNLAVLYLEQQKFDLALTHFKRANELKQNDVEAVFGIGMAYRGNKDFDNAKIFLQKALTVQPNFQPAQEMLNELSK